MFYKITMHVVLFALIVAFLWGAQTVVHKYLLKTIDPKIVMIIGGLTTFVCLTCFALYHRKDIKRNAHALTPRILAYIIITSILTVFVANLIYFYILSKNDSYIVSALIYASPVFTFFLAICFLKEKITYTGALGVFFIVLGVICMVLHEQKELYFER